jgi:hypothetical protein
MPSGGLLGVPRGRMPGRLRGLDSQPLLALLRGHKGSRLLRPLSRLVDLFSSLAAAQRYQDRGGARLGLLCLGRGGMA